MTQRSPMQKATLRLTGFSSSSTATSPSGRMCEDASLLPGTVISTCGMSTACIVKSDAREMASFALFVAADVALGVGRIGVGCLRLRRSATPADVRGVLHNDFIPWISYISSRRKSLRITPLSYTTHPATTIYPWYESGMYAHGQSLFLARDHSKTTGPDFVIFTVTSKITLLHHCIISTRM